MIYTEIVDKDTLMDSPLYSPSRILKQFTANGDISQIPVGILERAANRGTLVHKFIAADWGNGEKPNDVFEVEGFLDAYEAFKTDYLQLCKDPSHEVKTELCLTNKVLGIKGIADFVDYQKSTNQIILYDWKTSSRYNKFGYPFQITAYAMLLSQLPDISPNAQISTKIIQLSKKGEYRIRDVNWQELTIVVNSGKELATYADSVAPKKRGHKHV